MFFVKKFIRKYQLTNKFHLVRKLGRFYLKFKFYRNLRKCLLKCRNLKKKCCKLAKRNHFIIIIIIIKKI